LQLPERYERLVQTLSADEQLRAERFRFEQVKRRFKTGRGLLRLLLSRYLEIAPAQIQFEYGVQGKPALAEKLNKIDLRFNLAHSEDFISLAVSCGREIGLDLELIRPLKEAEKIAEQFFSTSEYTKLCSLTDKEKVLGFFNCWTRKEAYIKAQGSGLAYPLNQFEVSLAPGEPPALLNVAGAPQETSRWSWQELIPAEGYLAALIVEGHNWNLACWDFFD